MARWGCIICGYIYDSVAGDPDNDLPPGIDFEELPDDFECPECGAPKDQFERES